MEFGILLARLLIGLGIAAHGAQKLFGWFGGPGLKGMGGYLESLGFHPGRWFAPAAGLAELVGGGLIALGFLGPAGPALVIVVLVVAMVAVHRHNGFFNTSNGIEMPLAYATGAFLLALTGPGAYSLDGMLGLLGLSSPANAFMAAAVAVLLAFANLALRRGHAEQGHASHA